MDDEGVVVVEPTQKDFIKGQILTIIYSIAVIVLGTLYKLLAYKTTEDENHRYWKNFDDALINRLFIFNSLNFYVPMIFIALDYRNPGNFDELFSLLLTQLAVKQFGVNVVELFLPIFKVKPSIVELQENYKK
jgi:hypothetical protein